jgi:hypothetical protein
MELDGPKYNSEKYNVEKKGYTKPCLPRVRSTETSFLPSASSCMCRVPHYLQTATSISLTHIYTHTF